MDAARASFLLAGGLAVSTSAVTTAAQTVSIPHISPHARRRRQRRFLRLASAAASSPPPLPAAPAQPHCSRWVVVMERPPAPAGGGEVSRVEAVDYYVATLARVLGSQEEAQMRIYDASWDGSYKFCCEIDDEASGDLAKMPGVLAVRPDKVDISEKDNHGSDLSAANLGNFSDAVSNHSSSSGENEFWLVRMEKPGVEVVTKAQMVDHYTQILMKVLGNEKDAQVSIYHISWERDYGFCCHIDEECAKELAVCTPDVPGVLSVQPDTNFGSDNKNYKGDDSFKSSEATQAEVKTKRLFVTGLSFYTSEKTLRAAFEPFGELVEVKIIMDKISKRSKGYAFIEYTTEEAGGAALKAMNGQIINGWMIVVDVAKNRSRDRQPPSSASGRSHQVLRSRYHTG
uniref:Organelle RRM domain-containing protein 1, chloroplastic n=1 Tax=Oryza punctata TaxID=4537 RepID=A0A0E0K4U9_ORYPU